MRPETSKQTLKAALSLLIWLGFASALLGAGENETESASPWKFRSVAEKLPLVYSNPLQLKAPLPTAGPLTNTPLKSLWISRPSLSTPTTHGRSDLALSKPTSYLLQPTAGLALSIPKPSTAANRTGKDGMSKNELSFYKVRKLNLFSKLN